ncbi:unnamed protein product [Cuscuta europaea]|uniref:Uncharacterized protein n=1 Tax=Cuscuta europaea TaxID=41803 RepID=A0A9P1E7P9_CUSEU|nr:unnamed protein product [Cuscuta europaea]
MPSSNGQGNSEHRLSPSSSTPHRIPSLGAFFFRVGLRLSVEGQILSLVGFDLQISDAGGGLVSRSGRTKTDLRDGRSSEEIGGHQCLPAVVAEICGHQCLPAVVASGGQNNCKKLPAVAASGGQNNCKKCPAVSGNVSGLVTGVGWKVPD